MVTSRRALFILGVTATASVAFHRSPSFVAGWQHTHTTKVGCLRSSAGKHRGRAGDEAGQTSERLRALFDLVDEGSKVADVGCDHGLLALMLLEKSNRVIGIDVAEAPLENALLTATKAGISPSSSPSSRLELRLGDGLSCLSPGEVDTVCIAGVGTGSLIKILQDKAPPPASAAQRLSELSVRTVVLQPYRPTLPSMVELRGFLAREGVAIADETLLQLRGRFYITLRLSSIEEPPLESSRVEELVLGRHLRRRALGDAATRRLYTDYLKHHLKWHGQLISKRTCETRIKRDRLFLDVIQQELDVLGNQLSSCHPPLRQ